MAYNLVHDLDIDYLNITKLVILGDISALVLSDILTRLTYKYNIVDYISCIYYAMLCKLHNEIYKQF